MLKTRIIGVVLVKNGIAVQSIQFKKYLPIGKPEIVIRYLNRWGIDEIIVLHLDGAYHDYPFSIEEVRTFAKQCHVPLAIGGGIRDIETVKKIIRAGADKIILNKAANVLPHLITQSSDLFGQQCVVVSIDAERSREGKQQVKFHGETLTIPIAPSELAKSVQALGAGEIFLTSMNQNGLKQGYDLALIKSVVSEVQIPVIACGGVGHPSHALQAMQVGASAVAVGNYFNFTEHSVILFKKYLAERNAAIRHDCYVSYADNPIDATGRVAKHADELLNSLRFQYLSEEAI